MALMTSGCNYSCVSDCLSKRSSSWLIFRFLPWGWVCCSHYGAPRSCSAAANSINQRKRGGASSSSIFCSLLPMLSCWSSPPCQ